MSNLPINTPAEVLAISPEALEVANCYLATQSILEVSQNLGLPTDIISSYLSRKDVRNYIDNVFLDLGYNNQFKISGIMDDLIDKKLAEMNESDIGSSKDITEILALKHKMTMETLDRQIKLETLRNSSVKSQVNIQVNEAGGSNYSTLLEKLVRGSAT